MASHTSTETSGRRVGTTTEPEQPIPSAQDGVDQVLAMLVPPVIGGRRFLDESPGYRVRGEIQRRICRASPAIRRTRSSQTDTRCGLKAATRRVRGLRLYTGRSMS